MICVLWKFESLELNLNWYLNYKHESNFYFEFNFKFKRWKKVLSVKIIFNQDRKNSKYIYI